MAIQQGPGRRLSCALRWVLPMCFAVLALPLAAQAPEGRASDTIGTTNVTVERIGNGPVIRPDMAGLEGAIGDNIDGPSVIRVPSWIEKPLGKYYMYFAHHRGTYIRLAYADRPEGPWTVYKPGTLRLDQTSALHHIASPEAVVDEANKRILLYYHGATEMPGGHYGGRPYAQRSFVAASSDGVSFRNETGPIAMPYLRVFGYKGAAYGFAMSDKASAYPLWLRSGQFFRSETMTAPFEAGPRILDEMRHAGLTVIGDQLHIFYTNVGESPERIYHSSVDLRPDWADWTATMPTEVLRPERAYEGATRPLSISQGGPAKGFENALRDPAILQDDGRIYLYYSVAGEKGIAVARVSIK